MIMPSGLSTRKDVLELKKNLEMSADVTLNWFHIIPMQVNPEKFQTLVFKHANKVNDIELNIFENVWGPCVLLCSPSCIEQYPSQGENCQDCW